MSMMIAIAASACATAARMVPPWPTEAMSRLVKPSSAARRSPPRISRVPAQRALGQNGDGKRQPPRCRQNHPLQTEDRLHDRYFRQLGESDDEEGRRAQTSLDERGVGCDQPVSGQAGADRNRDALNQPRHDDELSWRTRSRVLIRCPRLRDIRAACSPYWASPAQTSCLMAGAFVERRHDLSRHLTRILTLSAVTTISPSPITTRLWQSLPAAAMPRQSRVG